MTEQKTEGLSILAVDDNEMNLILMKSIFKYQEYQVYYANCGELAIDMARKLRPDMILLDVIMPDINGFEVCRILKEDDSFKEIPVIFITAADEIESIVNGFEVGGVDYITKPFRKEEILLRIKTHFELKLTRDQLNATTKSLHELSKVKDRLFSIIGHDLRSPIGNVKMVLEFLSKGIIDPSKGDQYKKTISDLLKTTDEVFLLLENLLAWSVSESDDLKIVAENVQLRDVVAGMVNLFQIAISDKSISLEINIDNEHVVFADLNMLKTVIRNLFSNAIKFTPSEGKIAFDSWNEGGFIKIGVSDTGMGMPQKVVERFLGANSDYSVTDPKQESASGLGLKLCKDFIEKNGGKIWIESAPQMGTRVFFTLPCRNGDSEIGESKTLIW